MEKLCGVFSLDGISGENRVMIKHLENIKLKDKETIQDTLVEKYQILPGIMGEIYICNITDTYLMVSKTLPMVYASIVFEKPMRRILLFRVYLCFTISTDIKNHNELLNSPLDGKFAMELFMDGKKIKLDDDIGVFTSNDVIYTKLKNFVASEEMKNMIHTMVSDINQKLEDEYRKDFEYFKLPTKIISLKNYKPNE